MAYNQASFNRKLDCVTFHIRSTFEQFYFMDKALSMCPMAAIPDFTQTCSRDRVYHWLRDNPPMALRPLLRDALPATQAELPFYRLTGQRLMEQLAIHGLDYLKRHAPDILSKNWLKHPDARDVLVLYLFSEYVKSCPDIRWEQHYKRLITANIFRIPPNTRIWDIAEEARTYQRIILNTLTLT